MQGLVLTTALSAIIDLDGANWKLTNGNSTVSVTGSVPSYVHLDLLKAGVINDPYAGYNDVALRWITKENWTYTGHFDVKRHNKHSFTLVAEGIDTRADVSVNGKHVMHTENMFVRYETDLRNHLKEGANTITIKLFSPYWYAAERSETYPSPPVDGIPPGCPPDSYNGICHGNFMRKEPSSFGWDWGPAFAPSGIHKSLYIVEDAMPLQAAMQVSGSDPDWSLHISITKDPKDIATVTVIGTDGSTKATYTGTDSELTLDCKNVTAWWPRGYGAQVLYKVTVVVGGQVLSKNVGFRTVELVQDETLDMTGKTFYFKINGVAVFMKGANWVPPDAFETRVTTEWLAGLFDSFHKANFNALRVWGGGVYQQDAFYDLADRMGILLWQESMFACAMYPSDDEFLSSVQDEVTYQVERLGHHPAIILWSANNENEAALVQDWYGKTNPSENPVYSDMYRDLYWKTVLANISAIDGRPVLASSPSSGWKETEEDPVREDCNDDNNGDVHSYDYQSDCWDQSKIRNPRFISEFGLQSWSSYETLLEVASPDDLKWGSKWTQQRQHCDPKNCGNDVMKAQASLHYKWPSNFTDQIYMTQVQQAYCMKVQVEHHRRNRDAAPNTMGTLYWQANDIWQTVSWSSLEYNNQWKMMHYYAELFYTDVLLSAFIQGGEYQVTAVNDKAVEEGGLAQFRLYKWGGGLPYQWVVPFSVPGRGSVLVERGDVSDLIKQNDCGAAAECVLQYTLLDEQGQPTYENFLLLDSPKLAATLGDPHLKLQSVVQKGEGTFELTLMGTAPAPFTWLSFKKPNPAEPIIRFSKNGFLYTPDSPTTVTLVGPATLTVADVNSRTVIRSLGSIE